MPSLRAKVGQQAALRKRFRWRGIVVALLALALVGAQAAAAAAHASSRKTSTLTRVAARSGSYLVVVTLPQTPGNITVSVSIGSHVRRNIALTPYAGSTLGFYITLRRGRFTVQTVSNGAAVRPTKIAVGLQAAAPATPPTPTGSTGATGATGPIASNASYNTLVWSDEFTGASGSPPDPTKWQYDTGGGCGTGTLSTNTSSPANAGLTGNGQLAITASRTSGAGYTSAQLDSAGSFSFNYGRIDARIKLPVGAGLCSAFWLLGDTPAGMASCWPNCGEMDVAEAIGQDTSQVFGTLHGPVTGSPNDQQWQGGISVAPGLAGSWHTYGLVWRPGLITWTLDGVPYASATRAQLPEVSDVGVRRRTSYAHHP